LSVELSEKRAGAWVEGAVLWLDRVLRRHHGIYEYTAHPECILRIERAQADQTLTLSDGTHVRLGDPILKLHLWNEHMPPIGPRGPTVAWGRHTQSVAEHSLRLLASYLKQREAVADVVAICADMRLTTARRRNQLARITTRLGFEAVHDPQVGRPGALRRVGENILMFLLVLATNPLALRGSVLLRDHQRVYLSRAALEQRYGSAPRAHERSVASERCAVPRAAPSLHEPLASPVQRATGGSASAI